MASDEVHLIGCGASTPLGRDPWASAAAVRAGISGHGNHAYLLDSDGKPMRVAAAPWLEPELALGERFEVLLWPAIDQALRLLDEAGATPSRVALALALPAPRPGLPVQVAGEFRTAIARRYGMRFTAIALFAQGHAAGLLALQAAQSRLADGTLDACVVAGVDSYLEAETLEWLEAEGQFHGAGQSNNAWGFVPGEAAGALLLMGAASAAQWGLPAAARLLAVGSAVEPCRIKTRTVCIGEGLTAALRAVLAGLPAAVQVTDIVCDMNGEPYRADEFGFAALRVKPHLASASQFIAPAAHWGDVGAASGVLGTMLAAIAGAKGYARGPTSLVWASSEGGERAAALLHVPCAE